MKLIPTSINTVTITLYQGIPFDNNYEEHTFLSSKFTYRTYAGESLTNVGNNKEAFLNMKKSNLQYLFPRTIKSGTYNFAYGNGLVTSVAMELTDNEINSNYMKVTSGTDNYYYFITGITQKNESTYLLNLELDVIMTYTDEFLDSVANKPIMTERKHCRRILKSRTGTSGNYTIHTRINPVCFNQESTFSRMKANIVKEFTPLEFDEFITDNVNYNSIMKDLNWIYVIYGKNSSFLSEPYKSNPSYRENNIVYPYNIICFPTQNVLIKSTINSHTYYFGLDRNVIQKIVGDSAIQKIVISPFPPFKDCSNIKISLNTEEEYSDYKYLMTFVNQPIDVSSRYVITYSGTQDSGQRLDLYCYNDNPDYSITNGVVFRVDVGYGGKFSYSPKTNYFNVTHPSISNDMDIGEYKLQIAPFKDLRMSSFYGDENHINTQFLFLQEYVSGAYDLKPYTISTSNAECNSYYDYVDVKDYSLQSKRGINNSVAYNFPTGTDAETLYNQTAKSQYENSKVINAITNGLKIVGGGLSIALPFTTPMAKVAGGLAIASGVTGEIQTFSDWSSKMEDMRNTPNTYNFNGSSFPYDVAIKESVSGSSMLPYLITYGVTDHEYKMGAEFMYNYGYEYNAESFFNTELNNNDDNIFNRTLFNYVKIREDITTKVVSFSVPFVVAKKLNEILNAGIKLWNFFGMNLGNPSVDVRVMDRYFQKTLYCNAEYINE